MPAALATRPPLAQRPALNGGALSNGAWSPDAAARPTPTQPAPPLAPLPATPANPRAAFPTAERLLRFIDAARKSDQSPLAHLRRFYKMAEDETAGPWWKETHDAGAREARARRPISPLGEMVRTYHPHLIGEDLSPSVEPLGMGDRGSAKMLEYRLRQWLDDAGYAREDDKGVLDGILAVQIMYVFRNAGGMSVADENDTLDLGQPGVKRVSVHNMVLDPNCQDGEWDAASGIGHWIAVDRQALLDKHIGNQDVLNKCPNIWEELDETRGLSEKKNRGDEAQYLEDTILLWELCFTYRGKRFCCALPPVNGAQGFAVDPYPLDDEPDGSRYVVTMLNRLPGSAMPVSPAMVMMDAHLAKAGVAAKLVEQIETLERRYVIKPGAQDAVMRLTKRGHDPFVTGDPDKIKEFIIGGMVKELLEGYGFLESMGQKIGPNIQLAGGQEEAGSTATSNSILAGNAAVVMGYWKRQIDDGRTKVMRRVAAMLLQGKDRQVYKVPMPNGMTVPLVWDASTQDISYDQYRYKIKPTGPEAGMDPRERLRSLFEILTALPAVLQVLCVGLHADPAKVMRVISDLSGLQELDEMVPSGDSAMIQQALLGMLTQTGKASIIGAGQPTMGQGAPGMGAPGQPTGGMPPPQASPSPAPMAGGAGGMRGRMALRQSDHARRV